MKPIVEACFPEGEKDVNIELDKEHREIVYLMCSNNFAECVHKQKPKYQPPGQTETQPKPDKAEKIEAFIVSYYLIKMINGLIIYSFPCRNVNENR